NYVSDADPGIRRLRKGAGFAYLGPDGKTVDEATFARIRAIVIPPAWTNVWISPDPNGHIQATGRDQRGRKQYRYHPQWAEERDGAKYSSLIAFA
ncbi:DNA topoisomerase IB, partial [bacterium M00.F.Ca.ET.162.01.1.1]